MATPMTILNRGAVCVLISPNCLRRHFHPGVRTGKISANWVREFNMIGICNCLNSWRSRANDYA